LVHFSRFGMFYPENLATLQTTANCSLIWNDEQSKLITARTKCISKRSRRKKAQNEVQAKLFDTRQIIWKSNPLAKKTQSFEEQHVSKSVNTVLQSVNRKQ
jgi:shikimate kinase